jgi:uncharacterized protein (DUF427 family)
MMKRIHSDPAPAIRIEANPNRVRAMFAGHVIGDTTRALTVRAPGQEPVHYFPRQDVETSYLGKTSRLTHADGLGDASHFTIVMEGEIIENAIWSYEQPADGAEALKGYMAFSPHWAEVYELTERQMAMAPRSSHVHRSAA